MDKRVSPAELRFDCSNLNALIVDDVPGMRNSLRDLLVQLGFVAIDMAASPGEAITRAKNSTYKLIICDFNLDAGRDGQQLLEELRHGRLIDMETAFIMVTAESGYEKVAATAELAPDDYLIKPFNAAVLHARVGSVLQRKAAFGAIYEHYAKGLLEKAIAGCDALMADHPQYLVDAMRFKGELLNGMGRFAEAEALYRRVIEMRVIPWARLGLAKALAQQNRAEEAESILADVIDTSPALVTAYDFMADVQVARKDFAAAQATLQKGTAISARTVRRQQRLGDIAFENGDLCVAQSAYATALDKGRHSIFVTPSDYSNLCRVQVKQGNLEGALATLRDNRMALQASDAGRLAVAVTEGLVHTRAGRIDDANRALDEAAKLCQSGVHGDEKMMLDMAASCMAQGRLEESDAIVGELTRNAHDSEALLAKARKLYEEAGRAEAAAGVLSQATESIRRLNDEGVLLAQKGNLPEAMEKMFSAAQHAPYNPRIAMNAAWVALRHLEQHGMESDILAMAQQLTDTAEELAPGHPRIGTLRTRIRKLEGRYGIHRH